MLMDGIEAEFLIDGADTEAGRLHGPVRSGAGEWRTVDRYLAAVRLARSGEQPDQGRFACPVLAQQGPDFAGRERKIYAIERQHARVNLPGPSHSRDRLSRRRPEGDRGRHRRPRRRSRIFDTRMLASTAATMMTPRTTS